MDVSKAQFLLVAAANAVFVATPVHAEQYFFPKKIDTYVGEPTFATTHDECSRYQREMNQVISEVSREHDACLKDAPPDSSRTLRVDGACTKSACQGLHSQRDELREESKQVTEACRNRVNLYQLTQQKSSGSPLGGSSSQSFGSISVGVTRQAGEDAKNIHDDCQEIRSSRERDACLKRVHEYARNSRHQVPTSPLVKSIQDEGFQNIEQRQRDALRQFDEMETEEDGGWSQRW